MSASTQATLYSRDHPLLVRVVENRPLTRLGPRRDMRHFVVSIAGSGMTYQAGDSLGVLPTNRPSDIHEILLRLDATGEEPVVLPRATASLTLQEALFSRLSLAEPNRKAVELFARKVAGPADRARLEGLLVPGAEEALRVFLGEREFVDLLAEFPSVRLTAQEFVDLLRRLAPRLYSIASSPICYPELIHLTVGVVRYTTNNRLREGVCSTFLADRVVPGVTPVSVFLMTSHFRLPEDASRDLIMVGPGTGIAPFRAFLQEREATGATGRNWLFFGERHRATSFPYGDELEAWKSRGRLQRLDLAFSRDQPARLYVQHRMLAAAADLWRWLEGGAAFYVCGDAKRMAKDVDAALHQIVAEQGRMEPAEAAEYVQRLKREKRYQRDVY